MNYKLEKITHKSEFKGKYKGSYYYLIEEVNEFINYELSPIIGPIYLDENTCLKITIETEKNVNIYRTPPNLNFQPTIYNFRYIGYGKHSNNMAWYIDDNLPHHWNYVHIVDL